MKLPFLSPRADHEIVPLTRRDAPAAARLHATGFLRGWSAAELESLLDQQPVFGFAAARPGKGAAGMDGFVLARLAADEAEILTVVVNPQAQGAGLGRKLMEAVLRALHAQRAEALFLEVDEVNASAVALYRKLGFREVGRREAYYADASGRRSGALVMRLDLV